VADHPVVGPHRASLDVPGPVEDLDGRGQAEGALVERSPELGRLVDGGQVGAHDATEAQRTGQMGQHPPRLGKVEDDPVDHLVDTGVDVT
jgi:hypothetical protein